SCMRVALSILGILCSLFLIQASARFGVSRMFARYALTMSSIEGADEAVKLAPSDPEAHRARATIFNRLQKPDEAAKSLERATALRYRDDYLWIELGNTREELGDTEAALAALDQAVRWAPYYAHTHWQRGNLLLRMGRANDAFTDLRSAATTNPRYAPNLIDLAWGISRNDLKTTKALLDIKTDNERLALIRYLARNGKGKEVHEELRLLTDPRSVEYVNEVARLLFDAKAFKESFTLLHPGEAFHERPLLNSDFEDPLVLNESGFDWIVAQQQRNRLAIDVSEKLSGAKSLQINLDGTWTPGTPLLSQTFIVDPNTSYRLSFAVKTKDLVTGGPPLIVVNDASNNQLLGKSENFPSATTPWTKLSFDFTTLPTSQAAVIRLQRNNCDSSPCPIFGTLWLDEFSIEQTNLASKR
ncbi:MAG TPA: carbohydrate binding domain-containing protein, partial [Pyrinomonadaceae bacterium]|nr:carbohydrate binding domain-containing protein [Pyrinomonadaceae bacterium]